MKKPELNYFSLTLLLFALAGTEAGAQTIGERIYKRDVQPRRERLPNVINTLLHDEYAPAISPDGKTLVYQSNQGGNKWEYYRLWESKRDSASGFWTTPTPIEAINAKAAAGDIIGGPSLSYDGNTLYFFAKMSGSQEEDIFVSTRGADGKWGEPKAVGGSVNTGDYEGFPSISADGSRLYFMRKKADGGDQAAASSESSENKANVKVGTVCYKLMVAKADVDGNFSTVEELPAPINTGCEKHIRVMPDNQSVFFSSTRGGGSPKKSDDFDLYFSEFKAGGSWDEPKPADMSPLVKNTLYSYQPDMLVSVAPHDEPHVLAYFSAYQGASHEIFTIPLPETMKPKRTCHFKAVVVDSVSGQPLEVVVKVENETRPWLGYDRRNEKSTGKFNTVITEGNKYKYTIKLDGYKDYVGYSDLTNGFDAGDCEKIIRLQKSGVLAKINTFDGLTKTPVDAALEIKADDAAKGKVSEQEKLGVGQYKALLEPGTTYTANATADPYTPATETLDLTAVKAGEEFKKDIFLFDFSKIAFDNINYQTARPRTMVDAELDAAVRQIPRNLEILDKVYAFMMDYPQVKVSIQAHTDDRGKDPYNMGLSERRAAAAKQYLVKKGIPESRLEIKAFGETSPQVPNNGAANWAINRRVEFKVAQK
jgi:hypothetical protein